MPRSKSISWYIEARSSKTASAVVASGSAVAVILTPPGDKVAPRRFLLTCCHCVRAPVGSGDEPRGQLLPHILCWPHGRGYSPIRSDDDWPSSSRDGSWSATIVDIYDRPEDVLTQDQIGPGVDWILLNIDEASFQEYETVHQWSDTGHDDVSIVGFPEGNRHWHVGSEVEAEEVPGFRLEVTPESPAQTRLSGPGETAPGMSGGGMFNADGELVGIHRSRRRVGNSVGGVSAAHIAHELQLHGYGIPSFQPVPKRRSVQESAIDFVSFIANIRSIQSNLLKLILAAPFLDLILKVGPSFTDRTATSFIIVLLQAVAYLLVFILCTQFLRLRRSIVPVVVCAALFVVTLLGYGHFRNEYVVTIEQKNDEGIEQFSTQEVIGARDVFQPGFESLANKPPREWLRDFPNPESVQPIESIRASKTKLWWSWLGVWLFGSLTLAFSLLKSGSFPCPDDST